MKYTHVVEFEFPELNGYTIDTQPTRKFEAADLYISYDLGRRKWLNAAQPMTIFYRSDFQPNNELMFRVRKRVPKLFNFVELLDADGMPVVRPPQKGEWFRRKDRAYTGFFQANSDFWETSYPIYTIESTE